MKNIVFDASCLTDVRLSGIGHSTLELVRALERHSEYHRSFNVTLLVAYDQKKKIERWAFKNVRLKTFPIPARLFNILWKFDLLPPIDLIMPKGVYIFPNYKNWRLIKSKAITYVHDISFVLYPEFVSPKNQKFLEKNMPKWLKRTWLVAADSESARSEIIDFYRIPEEKIITLTHGVDRNFFYKRSSSETNKVLSDFGIKKEGYLLYVGNIEPRKNIENIIEAYKLLPEQLRQNHQFLLIGGLGWLNEPIYKSIEEARKQGYEITKVNKYVEDEYLPAFYSAASATILASHYEGFGLSLVQSMSCGTPVIAADNSSMKEVVGNAGEMVDSSSVESIAKGMKSVLDSQDKADSLKKNGLERSKKYDWNLTADKIVNVVRGPK